MSPIHNIPMQEFADIIRTVEEEDTKKKLLEIEAALTMEIAQSEATFHCSNQQLNDEIAFMEARIKMMERQVGIRRHIKPWVMNKSEEVVEGYVVNTTTKTKYPVPPAMVALAELTETDGFEDNPLEELMFEIECDLEWEWSALRRRRDRILNWKYQKLASLEAKLDMLESQHQWHINPISWFKK